MKKLNQLSFATICRIELNMFSVILFCCMISPFVSFGNNAENKKDKARVKYPIELDYTKDYPKKEIDFADIAEIEFISFKDEGVLLDGDAGRSGLFVSDKHIVLANSREGTVFVFDRSGKLISKFNKKGKSREEYTNIFKLTVDFKNKEIFVVDVHQQYRILVYSFDGTFKRRLAIPEPLWVRSLIDYDSEYLLAHFEAKINLNLKADKYFYYFISKSSGEFVPLDKIAPEKVVDNMIKSSSSKRKNSGGASVVVSTGFSIYTMIKNGSEVLISDFGCNTIYINSGKQITPFIVRTPPLDNNDEPTLVYATLKTDKYTFLTKKIKRLEDLQEKNFVIDNYTGEIFEHIITPRENHRIIGFNKELPHNYIVSKLTTFKHVELYENGELEAKLKKFVSTLKSDDNDFLMIMKIKE